MAWGSSFGGVNAARQVEATKNSARAAGAASKNGSEDSRSDPMRPNRCGDISIPHARLC